MPTLRQAVLGLVVLGFGFASAALTPAPAWAEGIGPRVEFPTLKYSPDEDQKDAYSQPENFVYRLEFNYKFSTSIRFSAPVEEAQEESPSTGLGFRTDFKMGSALDLTPRFIYRFPGVTNEDDSYSSTTNLDLSNIPLKFDFNVWTNGSILDEFEEKNTAEEQTLAGMFSEHWKFVRAFDELERWMTPEGFERLIDEFGTEDAWDMYDFGPGPVFGF